MALSLLSIFIHGSLSTTSLLSKCFDFWLNPIYYLVIDFVDILRCRGIFYNFASSFGSNLAKQEVRLYMGNLKWSSWTLECICVLTIEL
jgi:hypothetical protein